MHAGYVSYTLVSETSREKSSAERSGLMISSPDPMHKRGDGDGGNLKMSVSNAGCYS